jgi:hypothetical protein
MLPRIKYSATANDTTGGGGGNKMQHLGSGEKPNFEVRICDVGVVTPIEDLPSEENTNEKSDLYKMYREMKPLNPSVETSTGVLV